jgi:hypothetical protein
MKHSQPKRILHPSKLGVHAIWYFLCLVGWVGFLVGRGSYYVVQADLKYMILLSQTPRFEDYRCWNYRHAPPCLTYLVFFDSYTWPCDMSYMLALLIT